MVLAVHKRMFAIAAFALCFLWLHPACAQDDSQSSGGEKPRPAGTSFPTPINPGEQEQSDQTNLSPDIVPLTGVLNPTLGTPEMPHS